MSRNFRKQNSLVIDDLPVKQNLDGSDILLMEDSQDGHSTKKVAVQDIITLSQNTGLDFVRLNETTDPTPETNDGYLYVKDYQGTTQLYYMDSSGLPTQITFDGYTYGLTVENGFENAINATLSFIDGLREFTITPSTSFAVWSGSKRYIKTSPESLVISNSEGLHYICYDTTGQLIEFTSFIPSILTKYAFVAVIYWDLANQKAIRFSNEKHGRQMDAQTHLWMHTSIGTTYVSGLALGDFVINGTGNLAANAQCSVGNGVIRDEDLQINIVDGSPQDLYPTAQLPLFYRSGSNGDWRKLNSTGYLVTTTGTGRAAFNEYTGSVWQLSEVSNNDFVLTHLYATNDNLEPVLGIIGQNQYSTISSARSGATTELNNLSFGQLSNLITEARPIGTIILETSNTYSNAVKSRTRTTDTAENYVDFRTSKVSPGIGTILDHGSLSGLNDDDHLQYLNTTRGDVRYPLKSVLDAYDNSIHTDVSAEISTLLLKSTPVSQDIILGENSTDGYSKIKIKIGSLIGGTTSPLTTKGDVYTYSTANARLGVGSDGYALLADSTQPTGLKWGAVSGSGPGSSPLTTKGDLFGFSTVDARLPIGPDGYILQVDSTQSLGLKWALNNTASYNHETYVSTGQSPGTTITFSLINAPYADSISPAGYAINVYRNGRLLKCVSTLNTSNYDEFTYTNSSKLVSFKSSGLIDEYDFIYFNSTAMTYTDMFMSNPEDRPPTSPSAYDDEFNGISLDPKWSWVLAGPDSAW